MENLVLFGIMALCSSIISGISGLGGGILLLAFMTPLFAPNILIPLHGTVMLCSNLSRVSVSYKNINPRIIGLFTVGALIGALAGAPFTVSLPKDTFGIILAVAILFMTWLPKLKREFRFPGQFLVVGAVASFLSLFIGATGPFTAPFFLKAKLGKDGFVVNRTASNIPVHLFKLGVYMFSGFILSQWWQYLAVAVPMVFIGSWIGKQLLGKIPEDKFTIIMKVVISILVLRMLLKAFHII